MSHVTLSKARIQNTPADLEGVREACKMLGLVFCEGQKTHKWFGSWQNDFNASNAAHLRGLSPENYGHCDHVIRMPWSPHEEETYARHPDQRPYEIGLVKMPDGTFALAFDTWSGGKGVKQLLAKVGGAECGKLMQTVAQCKTVAAVVRQPGYYVKQIDDLENGFKKVVIGIKQGDAL